jgi:DNA-binding LacI/PurR family transcriptional regulator
MLMVNPFQEDIDAYTSRTRRSPALAVGAQSGTELIPSYDVDNHELAELAVAHLAKLGHKRLGYIGGGYYSSNSRERLAGFEAACKAHGEECPEHLKVKCNSWQLTESERGHLADVLRSNDRPGAMFAAGYQYCLEVYAAASKVGLRIPDDMSLMGVDDPSSAAHLTPPMTTIAPPLSQMGYEAAAALFNHLRQASNSKRPPLTSRKFEPELHVRESAAPPH